MLRTLGASRRVVFQGVAAEFTALGLLSACWRRRGRRWRDTSCAREVFNLEYSPDPWVWVIGIVGGALWWVSRACSRRARW